MSAAARACSVRAAALLALAAGPVLAAPFAYVTNQGSHDVSVVDLAQRRVVATVPVDRAPAGVAAHGPSGRVYVGHPEAGTIAVIDMRSQTRVGTLAAGGGAMGLAVSPDGRTLYAADWSRNQLLAIDTTRPEAAPRTIAVGRYPAGLAVHPDGRTVYVAERDDDRVAVVDVVEGRVRERLATGEHPFALALDAARGRLYALNVYSDDLSVFALDGRSAPRRVPVGKAPYGATLSGDGRRLFVSNQRADSLSVLDAQTLAPLATLDGYGYPEGIAAHGDTVLVVNWMDETLAIVDAASGRALATVPTGRNSRGFGAFVASPPP